MTLLLLLCLGLSATLVAAKECHCKADKGFDGKDDGEDSFALYKLQALEDSLQKITEKVQLAKKNWKTQIQPEREKFLRAQNHLLAAVAKLEGDKCHDDKLFACDNKCISNLLVCDGSNDCQDGADESADQCKVLAQTGLVLQGDIRSEDTCPGGKKPHTLRVVITKSKRINHLKSTVKLQATVVLWFYKDGKEVTESFTSNGFYNFGRRQLELVSPLSRLLALHCKFDGVHEDSCQGQTLHVATGDQCAEFTLKKFEPEHDKHGDHGEHHHYNDK